MIRPVRGNPRTRNRGASMTELMIAIGITAFLAAGVFMALSKNSKIRKSETEKNRLLHNFSVLSAALMTDLNAAVKVTGYSAKRFPGIARINADGTLAGPRANASDNDSLGLFIGLNDQFRLPLKTIDSQKVQLEEMADSAVSKNISRYMKESLKYSEFLFASGSEFNNILKISNPIDDKTVGIVEDASFPFNSANFSSAVSVGNSQRVEWHLMEDGTIVRSVRSHGELTQSVRYARDVLEFKIDYTFANRRKGYVPLQIPAVDQKISHPLDRSYLAINAGGSCVGGSTDVKCCSDSSLQYCADWQDIDHVWLHIRFKSDLDVDQVDLSAAGNGFEAVDGKLNYVVNYRFSPAYYSLRLEGVETEGVSAQCLPTDPKARCKKECTSSFTNLDPLAPDWIGYGQYVNTEGKPISDYCLCGTPGNDPSAFVPPEVNFSAPQYIYGNDLNNERIRACFKYFPPIRGVGHAFEPNYWWTYKYPPALLMSQCFIVPNVNHSVFHDYNGPAQNVTHEEEFLKVFDEYVEWKKGDYSKTSWQNYISCGWIQYICDAEAQLFYGVPGSYNSTDYRAGTIGEFQPWVDKCKCETYGAAQDPNLTCNHNLSENSSPFCPNTVSTSSATTATDGKALHKDSNGVTWTSDGKKVYRVRTDSNKDDPAYSKGVLEAKQALQCQCFQQQYNGQYVPGSHGGKWGLLYDFRLPNPAPGLSGNDGSVDAISATAYYDDGTGQIKTISNRCDEAFCDDKWGNLACCSAPSQTFTSKGQAANYSKILPDYKPGNPDRSSYCSRWCDPNDGSFAAFRLRETRNVITGNPADTTYADTDGCVVNIAGGLEKQ